MKWLVRRLQRTRRWKVQLGTSVVLNAYFLNAFFPLLKRAPCTGFNCHACPAATFACPIGALQKFATLREVPFYLLGGLGLVGVLIGRLSCGWFCPFGFLQEHLYRVPSPKIKVTHHLRWMPYVFLIGLVGIVPYLTLELWFCRLCPAGTLEAGIPVVLTDANIRSGVGWFYFMTLGILAVFLVGMVFVKQPFCRFVCPLGAVYSPFNRHSLLQLQVDHHTCLKCGRCRSRCPMDLDISENASSIECIRCLECAKICPVQAVGYKGAESNKTVGADG